jgi:GT2 family glycosyltransferase
MGNVLICIVTRNNLVLSKRAVNSALQQQPHCDVMVTDNASTDGTLSWLKTKPVALMAFTKQLSLAACWNAALRAAWRMKYEAVLMLNNDVAIQDMTARILYAVNEPFVTCVSVGSEEQLAPRTDDEVPWLKANARPNPDYSCWMMRKSVTDQGIWFDESCYPAYTEDSSHHIELHRHGIRAICIDLPYLHHGASTLKEASEKEAIVIRRGAQRNRERFKAKYGCLPGTPEYEKLFSEDQFGIAKKLRAPLVLTAPASAHPAL